MKLRLLAVLFVLLLTLVGAELLFRNGELDAGGNIQISLAVTENPAETICIDGARGFFYNTTYRDYNHCGRISHFSSVYVGTCLYPLSPIEPAHKWVFWADVDNSSYFDVQSWRSTGHTLRLIGNVSASDSLNRLIPLCCGSSWQSSISIVSMEDFKWGSAAITGEVSIVLTITLISGAINDVVVTASRDCFHGNDDHSVVRGEPVGGVLIRVNIRPEWVRRFGPGTWYLTVASVTATPVEFSYSYAYTAIPWHECERNCLGQGYCNTSSGLCHCNPCHSGSYCQIIETCSNNGICEYTGNGTCKCLAGTSGSKCEVLPPKEVKDTTQYHDNLTRAGLTFLILGMVVVGIIVGIGVTRYRSGVLRYARVNS